MSYASNGFYAGYAVILAVASFLPFAQSFGQPLLSPIQTFGQGKGHWAQVDGNELMISNGFQHISHYVFDNGLWKEFSRISGPDNIGFGNWLDFDAASGRVLVGAYADDEFGDYSGSIYEYQLGNPWTFISRFVHPDSVGGQLFGGTLALVGDQVFVGTPYANGCGMVHIMDKTNSGWVESQRFTRENCDALGSNIHYDGEVVVIQEPTHDGQQYVSTLRVFQRSGDQWVEQDPLPPLEGLGALALMDSFGSMWIVGASEYNDFHGAAYVLERVGTSFVLHSRLESWGSCTVDCQFGASVGIGHRFVAVGSPGDSEEREHAGSIYVFRREGDSWIPAARLPNPRWTNRDWHNFGGGVPSLAIHGDYLTVGDVDETQAVYLYDLSVLGTSVEARGLPEMYDLAQNYPNPFNPSTTISYELPRLSEVTLTVYDVLGRKVTVLASGTQPAGTYEVTFDATELPSGIYFYRLAAGDYVETKRMVVVK